MLKPIFGLDLGGFPIYQMMLTLGFVAAIIMMKITLRKLGASKEIMRRVRNCLATGAIIGVAVANFANWFIHPELMDYSIYDRVTNGGFSFVFGLIALIGVAALMLRIYKVNVSYFLDLMVPSILLAQFFARLGCTFTGCCYGKEIELFGLGFNFPARELEAIFALVMFIVLCRSGAGKRLPIYLLSYGGFRFLVDFGRGDDRGSIFGIEFLSPTQIAAIVLIIVSIIVLATASRRAAKREAAAADGKKRYEPLPNTYISTKKKHIALRIIAWILIVCIVLSTLFVVVNPFNISALNDFKYTVTDWFGFLFKEKSTESDIGVTNGLALTYITDKEKIVEDAVALRLIKEADPLRNGEITLVNKQVLKNGDILYVFSQTKDGRFVLGKTQVLVTGENGEPKYIAGDSAAFSQNNFVIDTYTQTTLTVAEAFGDNARVSEEMFCLYETDKGLLRAKHQVLCNAEGKPIIGVVVQEIDGRIVSFTKPELGVLSTPERNTIDIAINYVKAELQNGEDKIDTKDKSDEIKAIAAAEKKTGLSEEDFITALESAEEIADSVPNLSPEIFGQILSEEVQTVAKASGMTDKKAEKCAKKVTKAFKRNDIDQKDDETAIGIVAKSTKSSFKHKINYASDVDVFNVVAEDINGIALTFSAKEPMIAEIYNEAGLKLTTVYAEDKTEVKLYPEDGSSFVVKVSNVSAIGDSAEKFDYRIWANTFEAEEEFESGIERIVRYLEDSYDKSNLALLASIYAEDGEISTIDEIFAMGALPAVFESCNNVNCGDCGTCGDISGTNSVTDLTKSLIAELIIPVIPEGVNLDDLEGTDLSVSVFDIRETDRGTAVKAKISIMLESIVVYDGYTFFRVQTLEKTDEQIADDSKWEQLVSGILNGPREYITEFNTDELLAAFGDTIDNISGESDLPSLYALTDVKAVADGSLFIDYIDEQKALSSGHSREKLDDFRLYIAGKNIRYIEFAIRRAESEAKIYEDIAIGGPAAKDVYDLLTNPAGEAAEKLFSKNETTEAIWKFVSFMTDPEGAAMDFAVEIIASSAKELSEESKERAALYRIELEKQQAEYDALKSKN